MHCLIKCLLEQQFFLMSKTGTKHDVEQLEGNCHGKNVLLFTITNWTDYDLHGNCYAHALVICTCNVCTIMSITTVSILYITSGVEIASHAGHCAINLVNVR